ncbi:hypothetical protein BT63DRAFT_438172 [Microthyrium microscopicum]|uniref:Mid2 domain-containing protein n=1 Tax=Microthyrium microscopicum TaxID=703497 RepID=A0A6A6ULH1_9PEZI|nr:hypothetical protein BT63DRAFT_438172 [Microthyrium microscopicum]
MLNFYCFIFLLAALAVNGTLAPCQTNTKGKYPKNPGCSPSKVSKAIQAAECSYNTRVSGKQTFAIFHVDHKYDKSHGAPYGTCEAYTCAAPRDSDLVDDKDSWTFFWSQNGKQAGVGTGCIRDPKDGTSTFTTLRSCCCSPLVPLLQFTVVPLMLPVLLSLSLLPAVTYQQSSYVSFQNPYYIGGGWEGGYTHNEVWLLGSTQNIQWNTSLTTYNITLWQQNLTAPRATPAETPVLMITDFEPGVNHSMNWIVDHYDLPLEDSPVFKLWLNFSTTNGYTSPYFNITRNASEVTQSTISSSLVSTSSSTSSTTMMPTSKPVNAGLDVSTRLGLGIGLGIGIPFVMLLCIVTGIVFWMLRKKSMKNMGTEEAWLDNQPGNPGLSAFKYVDPIYEAPNDHESYQLGQPSSPAELADQRSEH